MTLARLDGYRSTRVRRLAAVHAGVAMAPHSVLPPHLAAASVHTSGGRPPEIVELSVVTLDQGVVSSTPLTWSVRPTRPVTCHAVRGYGIRVGDLAGRPPFAAVADEVAAVLEGRRLVAHGALVVADALRAELAGPHRPGRPDTAPATVPATVPDVVPGAMPDVTLDGMLDTLPLVRRVWPRAAPGSLPELAARARLRLPEPSSGTGWRAEATARLLLYLAERLADTVPDLTVERLCQLASR